MVEGGKEGVGLKKCESYCANEKYLILKSSLKVNDSDSSAYDTFF